MIDEVMPLVSRDGCQHCPYLEECESYLVYRCDKAQRLSDLRGMRNWGNKLCQEHYHGVYKRRHCGKCWGKLDQLIKEATNGP